MTKFVAPKPDETRKVYLHRAYGIGNGGGRGRIAAEGHAKIAEAMDRGFTFPDLLAASTPKAPKAPAAPKAEPKVTVPTDKRAEVKGIDPAAIRKWAAAQHPPISVGPRGRIAADVTLAYLDAVPAAQRDARENNGKDLRQSAPRVYPEGTTWRLDFTHKGEATTVTVSDRSACGNCGVSLSHHTCAAALVAVGYNDGPVRATPVYPKGFDA
jgi:pyruvate/2-oxoglutarate dehydrogenase complex dihydrolipoamide acyltransferase (E2) component